MSIMLGGGQRSCFSPTHPKGGEGGRDHSDLDLTILADVPLVVDGPGTTGSTTPPPSPLQSVAPHGGRGASWGLP